MTLPEIWGGYGGLGNFQKRQFSHRNISFPLESGVTLLEGDNPSTRKRGFSPSKPPFFPSTAWGCRPKTPLAAPLAGKMSQGYALLTEFSCGKLAVLSSKLTKFSQIGSPEAFSSKIRAHIGSLGAFSAKFALKLVRLERFRAKFALTLRRPTRFVANLQFASQASP